MRSLIHQAFKWLFWAFERKVQLLSRVSIVALAVLTTKLRFSLSLPFLPCITNHFRLGLLRFMLAFTFAADGVSFSTFVSFSFLSLPSARETIARITRFWSTWIVFHLDGSFIKVIVAKGSLHDPLRASTFATVRLFGEVFSVPLCISSYLI